MLNQTNILNYEIPISCSIENDDIKHIFDIVGYNILWAAILECAIDNRSDPSMLDRDAIYDWLRNTPRTSLVVELGDKITKMGYVIIKPKTITIQNIIDGLTNEEKIRVLNYIKTKVNDDKK